MKIRINPEDKDLVKEYVNATKPTGINKQLNGVDLLLWFQNKHLMLEDLPEGLALRQSDEITQKISNIAEIVKDFLYAVNKMEYTIEGNIENESRPNISI